MTKENLLIVVVGNVSRADLTSKIQAAFGSCLQREERLYQSRLSLL